MSTTRNRYIFSTTLAAVTSLATAAALAQPPAPPAAEVRAAMAKLAWLEGEWQGEGWRTTPQGKVTYAAEETGEYDVDGLVLVMHGRGWNEGPNGEIIEGHLALGVLSFDAMTKQYHFDAYVKQGYQSRGTPTVGEKEYRWSYPAGPNTEMRYHAWLSDDGEWTETGERCVGDACTPVMGMTLKKIAD